MIEQRLDRALKALGIPILGVSIGHPNDRSTWRIDYHPSATAQQRTDGDALRLSFDPTAQAAIDAEKAALASGSVNTNLAILALAQLDFEERQKLEVKAGQTLLTFNQCKARALAIYQSLL